MARQPLKPEISCTPPPLNDYQVGEKQRVERADDQQVVVRVYETGRVFDLFFGGFFLLLSIALPILLSTISPWLGLVAIPLLFVALYGVKWVLRGLGPPLKVALNRKTGTVALPNWHFGTRAYEFEEAEFFCGGRGESKSGAYLSVRHPPKAFLDRLLTLPFDSASYVEGNCEEEWAAVVWYMDRDRPLPPGTAFARTPSAGPGASRFAKTEKPDLKMPL